MRVQCPDCDRFFDDLYRWAVCPHRSLGESPHGAEMKHMTDPRGDEFKHPEGDESKAIDAIPAGADTAKAMAEEGVKSGDILTTDTGDTIRIGFDAPLDVFNKPHSKTPASCGRVVLVYSNRWAGPRPGIVTQAWGVSGRHQLINVTVIPDGLNDLKWLDEHGATRQGPSLGSVGLYDPLTQEERGQLIAGPGASSADNPPRYHAEWMPFQAGQAAKTEDVTKTLAARVAKVEDNTKTVAGAAALLRDAILLLMKSRALSLSQTDPATYSAVMEALGKK